MLFDIQFPESLPVSTRPVNSQGCLDSMQRVPWTFAANRQSGQTCRMRAMHRFPLFARPRDAPTAAHGGTHHSDQCGSGKFKLPSLYAAPSGDKRYVSCLNEQKAAKCWIKSVLHRLRHGRRALTGPGLHGEFSLFFNHLRMSPACSPKAGTVPAVGLSSATKCSSPIPTFQENRNANFDHQRPVRHRRPRP
jgi:hypothetical protein